MTQHFTANQVRGDIAITEAEPIRLRVVIRELFLGMPRFPETTPAAVGIYAAAQRVHASVEVGTNTKTVHPDVVTDIHDRGNIGVRKQFSDALKEARAADATDEDCDPRPVDGFAVRLLCSHIRIA
ncbi:hypothetical protein GCM10023318_00870 [Nocardia callitridis]|uniref:DUF222 domain-containing protein n=1 Tax=Nocardia callitridis TaxID=648753 RepID=A0ABP9JQJ4_9NOCA